MPSQPKLFDQVRDAIDCKHYSYKTEVSYLAWIRRFIAFRNMTPPRDIGDPEIEAFLSRRGSKGCSFYPKPSPQCKKINKCKQMLALAATLFYALQHWFS
jgi:hypothetical protein